MGIQLKSFNVDATNSDKRTSLIQDIKSFLGDSGKIKVLVHSIKSKSIRC